jgi:hypothetical protein
MDYLQKETDTRRKNLLEANGKKIFL